MRRQLKEFEIIESKAYIVHAYDEEQALLDFGNYRHVSEGDYWSTARQIGTFPVWDDQVTYS
tara:strand:- start:665 stop:850 length:186 start_codon:yes stop_codon:yes gene_type:complete